MFRTALAAIFFLLLTGFASAQQARVVSSCGSPTYTAGDTITLTMDPNGRLCDLNAPNTDTGALITHTAASAGVNGSDQINNSANGITLVIDITAITGTTPTLTVTIQGKDTASGKYYTLLASSALNATGTTVLRVFPGSAVSANVSANAQLPRTWRVITTIGGTTPAVTATIGASLIE